MCGGAVDAQSPLVRRRSEIQVKTPNLAQPETTPRVCGNSTTDRSSFARVGRFASLAVGLKCLDHFPKANRSRPFCIPFGNKRESIVCHQKRPWSMPLFAGCGPKTRLASVAAAGYSLPAIGGWGCRLHRHQSPVDVRFFQPVSIGLVGATGRAGRLPRATPQKSIPRRTRFNRSQEQGRCDGTLGPTGAILARFSGSRHNGFRRNGLPDALHHGRLPSQGHAS